MSDRIRVSAEFLQLSNNGQGATYRLRVRVQSPFSSMEPNRVTLSLRTKDEAEAILRRDLILETLTRSGLIAPKCRKRAEELVGHAAN